MIGSILVLGGGSAGFIAAITLKKRLPHLAVTVVRSSAIGVIGVGEGGTPVLPNHLHGYLGIDLAEFYAKAQPQWKLGIRFLWGPRAWFDYTFDYQFDTQYAILSKGTGFYCDESVEDASLCAGLMHRNAAFPRLPDGRPQLLPYPSYHIENEKFVAYLEGVATRMGIVVRDDTVQEVLQEDQGVSALRLASGTLAMADMYIDCSGFVSAILGKALREPFIPFKTSLYNDRAVVSAWQRTDEPIKPYTTAETMECGWCWQIDHENEINRGYVYSSSFISDTQAEAEFRAKNPKVTSTRLVRYIVGRYERSWVKNVVAIGNACGFVEPLESTGLAMICVESQWLAESLAASDLQPVPVLVRQYNKRTGAYWDAIRNFLSIHYRFNTRLDNPYWRECREKADIGRAAEFVEYYQAMGPDVAWRSTLLDADDQFGMEGYLALLIGQKVPHRRPYSPPPAELESWQRIRAAIARKASSAFSVRQALDLFRSPQWTWPANLFSSRPR